MRKVLPVLTAIGSAALTAALLVPAFQAHPAAALSPVTGPSDTTIYGCLTASHTLVRVSTGTPLACSSTQTAVSWAGTAASPSPSPTPTSPSPSPTTPSPSPTTPSPNPTPTTPSPSPSPTTPSPSPSTTGTWSCVVSGASGNCPVNGDYIGGSPNSNGYNTYVANNCWADPSCVQVLSANSPSDWQVVATQPAGNGSVMTGPELQQQFNNWCAAESTWQNLAADGCGANPLTDVPIASLHAFTGTYGESMPHDGQTIAEAAYDIWTNYSSDIMVWQDTVGRCNAGSFGGTTLATGVSIGGFTYDVYRYGGPGAEVIFVAEGAGGAGTCGNYPSGTVDILGVLNEAEALGVVSNVTVSLIDLGFEICSTGGVPETFAVSASEYKTS